MSCELKDNSHIRVRTIALPGGVETCAICDYGLKPSCPICGKPVERVSSGVSVDFSCPNAWGPGKTCWATTKMYPADEIKKAVEEWNNIKRPSFVWIYRLGYWIRGNSEVLMIKMKRWIRRWRWIIFKAGRLKNYS